MVERPTAAGDPVRGDSARGTGKSTQRRGVPSSLAAAGRWAGEKRQRGWEDHLAEFLAAILTWGGIGWLIDRWLDTAPGFMIAGIVLGNTLGIYLMWIRSNTDVHTPPDARRGRTDAGAETRAGTAGEPPA